MRTILRLITATLAIAMLIQASPVSAQSAAKQEMKEGSAKKEMVQSGASRAFTNGFNVPSSGVAIDGYCPVCYLAANKAVKGLPEITHDYNGVTYWFVKEGAKQAFIENPEKFLPAYGGWCAVGVATGQRFPVDPTNFKTLTAASCCS